MKKLGLISLIFIFLLSLVGPMSMSQKASAAVSGFVTRSGNHLMLGGNEWRSVGANIAVGWSRPGFDKTESGGWATYTSHKEIDNIINSAKEMGLNTLRAWDALFQGPIVGTQTGLNQYNETQFRNVDYLIQQASVAGIRLIFNFTDQYYILNTGKRNFAIWRGLPTDDNTFYTNSTLIGDFESFINTVVNRTNYYTGIVYKNDPAILAWENGNELYIEGSPNTPVPLSWVKTISAFTKSIDPNHLMIDGTNSSVASWAMVGQDDPNTDILTKHYYPTSGIPWNADSDAATATSKAKAFIVGEYDWTAASGGPSTDAMVTDVENNHNIAGDCFWMLDMLLSSDYGVYDSSAAWNVHYPDNTTSTARTNQVQRLRTHGFTMQGLAVPGDSAVIGVPTYLQSHGNQLQWAGAELSSTYTIERATASSTGPWTVISSGVVTDSNMPYTDTTQPTGNVWYRVKGVNKSGVAGGYSATAAKTANLALGKTATMDATPFTGHGASVAIDGNTSSYAQATTNVPWSLTVDLGSDTTFNQAVYTADSNNYASSYTIDVATAAAPTTWKTVYTQAFSGGGVRQIDFPAVTARYVKLHVITAVTGGAWGHGVYEFAVYNQGNSISVANAGFESPGTSTYIYGPMTNGWTFDSAAGVQHTGSAWSAPTAPEGVQTAFLQNTGSVSQTIYLTAGNYKINFQAALRPGNTQSINMYIGSTLVGACTPASSTSFSGCTSNLMSFSASGNYLLKLQGTSTGGDNTAFIDLVAVNPQ